MEKLYKVEFTDWGWRQVIYSLESFVWNLEQTNERVKKEAETFISEQVVKANQIVISLTNNYKYEIERQLEKQGYKSIEHLSP